MADTQQPSEGEFEFQIRPEAVTWADQKILRGWNEMDPEAQQDYAYELFQRVVVGGAAAVPVIYTVAAVQAILVSIRQHMVGAKN